LNKKNLDKLVHTNVSGNSWRTLIGAGDPGCDAALGGAGEDTMPNTGCRRAKATEFRRLKPLKERKRGPEFEWLKFCQHENQVHCTLTTSRFCTLNSPKTDKQMEDENRQLIVAKTYFSASDFGIVFNSTHAKDSGKFLRTTISSPPEERNTAPAGTGAD
jgi:hypothetical protein